MDKQYTKQWFDVRGAKTWDKLLHKRQIKTALEVGCYEGMASVFLLEKFKDMRLMVIDIFHDDVETAEDYKGYEAGYEARFENNVAPYRDRVTKIKGKSFDMLAAAIHAGVTFDFIYIDGDHRSLPALQDCVMAIEMLNDGGLMVIDDYTEIPSVNKAVDALVSLLPKDKYKCKPTSDGEQMTIKRLK